MNLKRLARSLVLAVAMVPLAIGAPALAAPVKATGTRPSIAKSAPVAATAAPTTLAFAPHAADSLAQPGGCARTGCHAAFTGKASVHAPVAEGMCSPCHETAAGAKPRLVNGDEPSKTCGECHEVAAEVEHAKTPHPPAAEGCLDCHTPHASNEPHLLRSKQPDLCYGCHEKAELAVHVIAGLQQDKGHPLSAEHDPSRKGEPLTCVSCHEPHASAGPRLFRWQAKSAFELCQHCHKF